VRPSHLLFGPDGNLYVGSWNTNKILRYNGQTGEFIDEFASGGELLHPDGFVFGPAPVPEPACLFLFAIGAFLLHRFRLMKKS